jgi:SAM-dependent methyltransferase
MKKQGFFITQFVRLGSKLVPISLYIMGRPIRKELGRGARTVLDIGCGRGLIGAPITRTGRYFTVGAEIYQPDLREAWKNHTHVAFVRCDIRSLPFRPGSFDIILCTEVLEHVTKEEGRTLLKNMEEIASRKVILSTPRGYLNTCHESSPNPPAQDNIHQEHQSGWHADELRALGYRVYYNRFLSNCEQFIQEHFRNWSWLITTIIFSSLAPLLWISPGFGVHLFCVKDLGRQS